MFDESDCCAAIAIVSPDARPYTSNIYRDRALQANAIARDVDDAPAQMTLRRAFCKVVFDAYGAIFGWPAFISKAVSIHEHHAS